MTKADKLRKRLLNRPKDFTWDELCRLMEDFGFVIVRTGGSGRKIVHTDHGTLFIHEPHPENILKGYQVRDVADLLTREGLL